MAKERQRPPKPPEEPLDLGIEAAINRCPYCHDAVQVETDPWVACKACLGRHHTACWEELGRCGSCGESVALRSEEAPASPQPVRFGPGGKVPLLILIVMFGVLVLAQVGLFAPSGEVLPPPEAAPDVDSYVVEVEPLTVEPLDAPADQAARNAEGLRVMGEATRGDDVSVWFPGILRGLGMLDDQQLSSTEVGFRLDEFRQGAAMEPAPVSEQEVASVIDALRSIRPKHRMLRVVQAVVGYSDLRFGEELWVVKAEERDRLLNGEVPVSAEVQLRAEKLLARWYRDARGQAPPGSPR